MNRDPLRSPKLKIDGAKRHIKNLDAVLRSYFAGNPYKAFQELDSGGLQESLIVRLNSPVPDETFNLVADAIHNLRSALDHLAVALASANGAKKLTDVYFPFGRDKQAFESAAKEKVKRIAVDARDIIYGLKPYKGGNDLLFALHELDCADKHQTFVPVGAAIPHMQGIFSIDAQAILYRPDALNDLEKGIKIMTFAPGTKVKYDFNLTTDIAFRDIDFVKGQPVPATLDKFVDLVEGIISLFETRFFC